MAAFFITSTGTDIGKTWVTTALAWQLGARGRSVALRKPVISGFPPPPGEKSDLDWLAASQGRALDAAGIEELAPWRFAAPLSPDMAAEREGRSLDFEKLVEFTRDATRVADFVLIEGVGGVAVPVDREHTCLDWMRAVGAPAILVVGSYLGTLSHTLTAMQALETAEVRVQGIVISASEQSPVPLPELRDTLRRYLGDVPCALIPRIEARDNPWKAVPPLLDPLGIA